jgi:Cdc6-like AAA superfamily ATPase
MNFESEGQSICIIKNSRTKKTPIISADDGKDAKAIFTDLKLVGDEKFQQIPNTKSERQILYITGASGSGKSYYCKEYCDQFRRLFPKRPIYLFSSISDDSSIDKIKGLKRIALTKELLEDDLKAEDFKDSMVIFDDVDCITDKPMKLKVASILNSVLETGRHFNVYCIYTSHLACAGNETKRILNEAHSITFFPKNSGGRMLKYLLDSYLGLDKDQIKRIKKLDGRWVTVIKSFPMVVLSEQEIYTLNSDDS